MHCPFCSFEESKVIDSRLVTEGSEIRRRRECLKCGERWTTFEIGELVMPKIIKQDKSRVPFDETKIREGIARSLEKRPVSDAQFQTLIDSIKKEIRGFGEREIESKQVGESVMRHLRKLDEVAFVRFASVYRSFQDLEEFKREIDSMGRVKRPKKKASSRAKRS